MKKLVAFSWFGGKTSHLKWLLPIINNATHTSYIESFGGSAAVLLNKQQSRIEVYNDIYSDVVNFFKVLRNQHTELVNLLRLTPYSREEFRLACNKIETSELERARQFFVIARQVRTGLATAASPGRWAYVSRDSRKDMALTVSRWLSGIDGLTDISERLKQVQIENLDALDVIKRYDTVDSLHYIDPPYLLDVRTGGIAYANEFSKEKT